MSVLIYRPMLRNIPEQSRSRVSSRPILYLDNSTKEDNSCISIPTAAVGQQQQ